MVIAMAGRRIDAKDAKEARFPAENEKLVRERIERWLKGAGARAVVSSAACGADILGLEAAGALGLPRRVVLPFSRDIFRETSVVDRGGDWGRRYDRLMENAEVVSLDYEGGEDAAYGAVNHAVLDEAMVVAADLEQVVTALLVWNGESRGPDDLTAAFGEAARQRGFPVVEISTL